MYGRFDLLEYSTRFPTQMTSYAKTLEYCKTHGQEHLLQFFDALSASQKEQLLSQINSMDLARINSIFKTSTGPKPTSFKLDPLPPASFDSLIGVEASKVDKWREVGLKAIREGKVGVILLAGGQGTRLGSSDPKGMYDIGLPSHKSLFQLQGERIVRLQQVVYFYVDCFS
jgi:UDP-N-acetylglucosamine/UDP-N-acetylgalactosamine diphosphorylase